MPTELQLFGTFMREHTKEFLSDTLLEDISQVGPFYAHFDEVRDKINTSYMTLAECLERDDMPGLIESSKTIGQDCVKSGFNFQEVYTAMDFLRDHLWKLAHDFMRIREPWSPALVHRLEDSIHAYEKNVSLAFSAALEQAKAELSIQAERLEAMNRTIRELSTPIMPIYEGVLVLPIVGMLDSYRAAQVMEKLLEAISSYQADLVIIDITGVPMVDTSVANHILQAARAAKLVGAHIILVGIGAEIAQTIVHLGVEMVDIVTLANLQEGIQYALAQLGIRFVALPTKKK